MSRGPSKRFTLRRALRPKQYSPDGCGELLLDVGPVALQLPCKSRKAGSCHLQQPGRWCVAAADGTSEERKGTRHGVEKQGGVHGVAYRSAVELPQQSLHPTQPLGMSGHARDWHLGDPG